jgi:predicted acyltransferase
MKNPKRLVALDVFRGLTIALMIIVNNPGSWKHVYTPLGHSPWHGCTPTDLVFPFFLFIMGSAMWYSFKKYGSVLTKQVIAKIVRRTVIIFLIGISISIYASFSLDFSHLRIMGVMNRIALAYGVASFIVLGLSYTNLRLATAIILLGYWAILAIFGSDDPFSLEGNFVGKFDAFVLGANHLRKFKGAIFDQTGLLATLPSVANVLLGYIAGRWIDLSENKLSAVKKLMIFGIAGIILGRIWDVAFPINKPLWTSSYVVYSSGLAMLLLGILLWVIDIREYKNWIAPFRVFGMNPLFLYVFAEFLSNTLKHIKIPLSTSGEIISLKGWIFTNWFQPMAGDYGGSLLFSLLFCSVCWGIGWILYRNRIFIKI